MRWLYILLIASLPACHSIKAIDRPELSLAPDWQTSEQAQIDTQWWQQFQSPELNRLIEYAQSNSPDLRVATERIVQAELQMNNAGASLFPAVNLTAGTGASRNRPSGGDWNTAENSRVAVGINYELDLWGRVYASTASAKASFKAQLYDYETARLTLLSSIASNWFNWLSVKQRLQHAQENIRIAEQSYAIVQARFENGAATAADLMSQEITLLSQQASLEPLQLQEKQLRSSIAILIGQEPFPFALQDETLGAMVLPDLDLSVPSELLTRRPDLAAAEARLQAADADVKQARASLLPSLQLSLSAGRSSAKVLSLSGGTDSLSANISLTQVIFDRARLRNQIKISQSQQISLVEQYRKSIYTALEEVDSALRQLDSYELQEQQQRNMLDNAEKSLALVQQRYQFGKDEMMTLLNAQRTVYQRKDQWIQTREAHLKAVVDLYKALGGGWQL